MIRALAILLMLFSINGLLWADGFSERRINVGLKLFRSLVVADLGYKDKLTPAEKLEHNPALCK